MNINSTIIHNYARLRKSLFFLPIILLALLILFLYFNHALNVYGYTVIQKSSFFAINAYLGQYPNLESNFTQFGDCLISLSLLSVFLRYGPKLWEALISASLISAFFSILLKVLFAVPRPAAVFNHTSFLITGKILLGNNSLPSGHSITIFTTLTVIMYAFMPQRLSYKIMWFLGLTFIGLMLALSRVALGAHYPLDVLSGCIIGYLSGLFGIFFSREFKIWNWINNKRYYPIFILLFLVFSIVLINRIINDNLLIFYFTFICLISTLYKIITVYAKK
ncbi:phosphatase PAP2 family protein [Sphingobacterium siyangense]|uniref:phosphatase PAP2 family protein n=1 Tax=Sphingobacterium siyangense TaxID=459529 RepID=UPI003C74D475